MPGMSVCRPCKGSKVNFNGSNHIQIWRLEAYQTSLNNLFFMLVFFLSLWYDVLYTIFDESYKLQVYISTNCSSLFPYDLHKSLGAGFNTDLPSTVMSKQNLLSIVWEARRMQDFKVKVSVTGWLWYMKQNNNIDMKAISMIQTKGSLLIYLYQYNFFFGADDLIFSYQFSCHLVIWHHVKLFAVLFVPAVMFGPGCTHDLCKDHVTNIKIHTNKYTHIQPSENMHYI
jgi:hypothetical protein